MFKEFLQDNDGMELVEYIAGGAVLVALLLTAVWTISTNAHNEGMSVGSYIDGINAPSSP